MKKVLCIYLIGVLIGWYLGYNQINSVNKRLSLKTTYGDVVFCSVMSLCSWYDVGALVMVKLSESDFWDTPI